MTRCEEIISAISTLVDGDGNGTVSRVEIRDRLGVNKHYWLNKYNADFQSMREDTSDCPPGVGTRFRNIFILENPNYRGIYILTDHGKELVREFRNSIV